MPLKFGEQAKLLTLDPTLRDVPRGGNYGGDVIRVADKYVVEAGDLNGQVVKVGRILKGQRFLDAVMITDGLGVGVTMMLGTQKKDGSADDNDRFITATAFANANTILRSNVAAAVNWEAEEDLDIIATIGGANPTAAKYFTSVCFIGRK